MLEINQDFEKQVYIPAVSSLRELGVILQSSGSINGGDINRILSMLQERLGENRWGLGIKTVLDCITEARAGEEEVSETLVDLLMGAMDNLRI